MSSLVSTAMTSGGPLVSTMNKPELTIRARTLIWDLHDFDKQAGFKTCAVATSALVMTAAAIRGRNKVHRDTRARIRITAVQRETAPFTEAFDEISGKLTKPFAALVELPGIGLDQARNNVQNIKVGSERLLRIPGKLSARAVGVAERATGVAVRVFELPGRLQARATGAVVSLQLTVDGIARAVGSVAQFPVRLQKAVEIKFKRAERIVRTVQVGFGLSISAAQGAVWLLEVVGSNIQRLALSVAEKSGDAHISPNTVLVAATAEDSPAMSSAAKENNVTRVLTASSLIDPDAEKDAVTSLAAEENNGVPPTIYVPSVMAAEEPPPLRPAVEDGGDVQVSTTTAATAVTTVHDPATSPKTTEKSGNLTSNTTELAADAAVEAETSATSMKFSDTQGDASFAMSSTDMMRASEGVGQANLSQAQASVAEPSAESIINAKTEIPFTKPVGNSAQQKVEFEADLRREG